MNEEYYYDAWEYDPDTKAYLYQELPGMVEERLSDLPIKGVFLKELRKNNGVKRIGIYADMGEDSTSPCAYLDSLIRTPTQMIDHDELEGIADILAICLRKAISEADLVPEDLLSSEDIPERLGLRLINSERNRDILNEVPHKDFLDLSAVLIWNVEVAQRKGIIQIDNKLLDTLGYSFEELYPIAIENMQRSRPYMLKPLEDIIHDMTGLPAIKPPIPFYCLTVKDLSYGSAAMLYPGLLHSIYEDFGEAFYVIPSSVNELLIIPASEAEDKYYLMDMIPEVNKEAVAATEVLSDSLYYYRPETDELELCTDERKGLKFCTMA